MSERTHLVKSAGMNIGPSRLDTSDWTDEEKRLAQRIRAETIQNLKERAPERVTVQFSTSTPWYKPIIEVGPKI